MPFFYTYILRSLKDKKMYTGFTKNLNYRLKVAFNNLIKIS